MEIGPAASANEAEHPRPSRLRLLRRVRIPFNRGQSLFGRPDTPRTRPLPLFVSILLLVPWSICAAAQSSPRAELEYSFATSVGFVVGAATACPDIDQLRIQYVSDRFTDFFKSTTGVGKQFDEVERLYQAATADGRRAVMIRSANCAKAVHDFAEWEGVVRSVRVAPAAAAPSVSSKIPDPSTTQSPTTVASSASLYSPVPPPNSEIENRATTIVRTYAHQAPNDPSLQAAKRLNSAKPSLTTPRMGPKSAVRLKSKSVHHHRRSKELQTTLPRYWLF